MTELLKAEYNKELECLYEIAIKNKSVGIDLDIVYEFVYIAEPTSMNNCVGFETHNNKDIMTITN